MCCICERKTPRMKPAAGMLREALARFGARAADTPFVGDQVEDLKAAFHAGCRRVLVRTGLGRKLSKTGCRITSGQSPGSGRRCPSGRARATSGPPRHGFRATIARTEEAGGAACAMQKDVTRVNGDLPCHWVTVHEVAQRLGLDDAASEAAVRQAIEHG